MVTDYEKLILAHGIIEIDDWLARTTGGEFESEIDRQIERLQPLYEAEKDKPGYRNAYERYLDSLPEKVELTTAQRIDAVFPQTDSARVIFEAFFELTNDVRVLKRLLPITRAQLLDWFKSKLG